ncbi:hypothetical protein [Falsiroseomonas sp.]|uniref:hypothetical protein n=1 Tax=Falsiroseomonas sp. TaxID=2870721 RepID=UPI003F716A8D
MTTTSDVRDSAEWARSLGYLACLGLAPGQVTAKVDELRPAAASGNAAAMLAALDQARAWWDAYDVAQRIIGEDNNPTHLTDGWSDLMELVARAPATSLSGILAKARLAAWTKGEQHGDADWDVVLLRTLRDGVAALAAMEGQGHG